MAELTRRQALAVGSGLAASMISRAREAGATIGDIDDPQSFDHRLAAVNGIRMHYVEE
jgi:hypothetical protein